MSVQDEVADTGLMMMGHRFYDPSGPAGGTGRFLNRDPIGFRGGFNLFEYAASRPAYVSDPRGLQYGDDAESERIFQAVADGQLTLELESLKRSGAATLDGLIPFGDPFAEYYDITDRLDRESQFLGNVAQQLLLWAGGLKAIKMVSGALAPKTLYHFTSAERAAVICGTAGAAGTGFEASTGLVMYGEGVDLTSSTSPLWATLQGAKFTQAIITIDATLVTGLEGTLFPTTYKAIAVPLEAIMRYVII